MEISRRCLVSTKDFALTDNVNELHLFAGAGGGILGGILLGHTCVCAVEIEPYCRKVLLQRQRDGILPKFPIWDDVRTFDGKPWRGKVDVVCGGFPCQDISMGGNNSKNGASGLEGERSGLWFEMARIICEIRPRFVFVENSSMLIARGLGTVLRGLAGMGYDARWGMFFGSDVGALHVRKRIWILANTTESRRNDWRDYERKNNNRANFDEFPKDSEHWKSRRNHIAETLEAFIKSESALSTMGEFNALADGVDRVEAAGNGQIPSVAVLAWQVLSNQ